jgi:hypothetical protein
VSSDPRWVMSKSSTAGTSAMRHSVSAV